MKVNVYVHDAKFTGTYSAQVGKKRIEVTATVEAPDHYTGMDKLREKFEAKYGKNFAYPVVRWKGGAKRLEAGSISERVAKAAGPEEDAAR